jgi:hypothetical protein
VNTLNRTITARFYRDENGYAALTQEWASLANNKTQALSAQDHLLYAILRGKDWRKGFVVATNPTKVANGATTGNGPGHVRAVRSLLRGYNGPLKPFLSSGAPALLARLLPIYGYDANPLPREAYEELI